jgi:hypothetical protein
MVQQVGSVSKRELTWDQVLSGEFPTTPAQQLFQQTVISVAAQAKAALPEANGRVDKARDLVLGGLVSPQPQATFLVRSQASKDTTYTVTPEGCTCPDAQKGADGRCKHRIATWIWRKARAQIAQQAEAAEVAQVAEAAVAYGQTATLPEAPASVNVHVQLSGRTVQLTLRDHDEVRMLNRLEALLTRFPSPRAEAEAPPIAPPATLPSCRYHGTEHMRPSKYGAGRFYCAVKLADESWCNQQWPPRGRSGQRE